DAGRAVYCYRPDGGCPRDPLGVRGRRGRRARQRAGRGGRRARDRTIGRTFSARPARDLQIRGRIPRDPGRPHAAPARTAWRARMINYLIAMATFGAIYAILALGLNV